ncbi:unnamed protein product [Chondrus crispus]|nr:unnamed protein product [Chondrus crispus]XP_005716129.1 unnamed protein product [Chondrus crispus]XP_005717104.1 unnamed protein product [Chondrus crispus]XP_005717656.1 unnamed protein product [Chondrus crispus]XP_005718152.1 unnamed protein product [Chondrus crispus]CDF34157.1 unnamed protein product [Chondrus crispus]CDF36310.1 unnamed protein product [Chondrus crispus]CDF37285.1 unnamed protein product [Chondrus crispus]CDF37785.1 unnamed protein product [Chondrus crispus]CDF38267.|eukprot:XP_005713976.1 unnamed protein product [Chondrus crispus]
MCVVFCALARKCM